MMASLFSSLLCLILVFAPVAAPASSKPAEPAKSHGAEKKAEAPKGHGAEKKPEAGKAEGGHGAAKKPEAGKGGHGGGKEGEGKPEAEAKPVVKKSPEIAEKLWNKAMDLQSIGDRQLAADTFLRVYQDYPQMPMAEDSLWRAILYYREQAMSADRAHWATVEELCRRFIIDFPDSRHGERVQFDLGLLHFEQEHYRDSLTRLKMFVKRYPNSPLVPRAKYLQTKSLLRTGQLDAARAAYEQYAESSIPEEKAKGLAGIGEIMNRRGEHEKAFKVLSEAQSLATVFFLNKPEVDIYRELGTSSLRLGKEEDGRQHLFRYLNVVGQAEDRFDVLLEIAESYSREGKSTDAQSLYELIVGDGGGETKAGRVAKFRLTQFRDDPKAALSKWQRRGDYQNSEEDRSYLDVLAETFSGEMSQEARKGLFRRYRARNEFEPAADVGRSFLRQLDDTPAASDRESANEILLYLAENLLQQGKFKEVYQLYEDEHRHVQHYPGGRLLYLVGQAVEKLSLHPQASVLYYRALALPLDDGDRIDLYYRRAGLYLALKDHRAADTLLSFLLDEYVDTPAIGEISYLYGRLREAEGKQADALTFFARAAEINTFPEKKGEYALAHLRLLLRRELIDEGGRILGSYRRDGRLPPDELQRWHVDFARKMSAAGRAPEARDLYLAGLGEGMPEAGRLAQKARLELGDLLFKLGDAAAGRAQYEKAASAADGDEVLKKLASERLRQQDLDSALKKMDVPKR